ncbi:MAG: hypothetical protein JNJ88_08315 [Planctomycetes bacterium]|nr:hypothetical protein [Planctomycetota bacterium]
MTLATGSRQVIEELIPALLVSFSRSQRRAVIDGTPWLHLARLSSISRKVSFESFESDLPTAC